MVAIVVQAMLRLGGRTLHNGALVSLAVASFLALAVFALPFPVVVLGAGVVGWLIGRRRPDLMRHPEPKAAEDAARPAVPDEALHDARPSARRNASSSSWASSSG